MQPGSLLPETVGFIAAILTTLSFLPQALRIRRLGSANEVSFTMYLMMVTGQGLWLIYGIVIIAQRSSAPTWSRSRWSAGCSP